MYVMVATKRDLAFAASMVSQFMSKPSPMHWMAVKRIMQYLNNILDMRLCIGDKHIDLKRYSNVDWVGNVENRRFTSGYIFFVEGGGHIVK